MMVGWLERIQRLFAWSSGPDPGSLSRAPDGLALYAIGDIHGELDLLRSLLSRIGEDLRGLAPGTTPVVIFIGDYIDRGPDSRGVVDLLASDPLPGVRCHFLRGNHEQAMLDFLQDPIGTADWLQFGGMATLDSYGVRIGGFAPSALMAARDDLISRLPGGHWDWLANLPLSATYGDYLFVHAGVRPGVPLDRQSPEDLMTIRAPFLEHRRSFGARVVHGHTITPTITVLSNRIGIDTGAYATGVLSAIRLTGIDLLLFEVKRA